MRQKDHALEEARGALMAATSSPSSDAANKLALDRLHRQIEEQRRLLGEEETKRKDAEAKEASATKHQSSLAKSQHELEIKVDLLTKQLAEAEKRRSTAEQRLNEVRAWYT